MKWINAISEKVTAVRTNLMVRIFAYSSGEMAPTNGPMPHPNVVVQLRAAGEAVLTRGLN